MVQQLYTNEELQDVLQETYYHLGRVLYLEGSNYDRAVDLLTQAVRQDEQNVPALYYLGQAIRAQVEYNTLKRAEEALYTYLRQGAPLGHEDAVRQFLKTRKSTGGERGQRGTTP